MPDAPLPIPEGLRLAEDSGKTIIRRQWYGPSAWAILIFALVWDGIDVFLYFQAFPSPSSTDYSAALAFLVLGFFSICITYWVPCAFFNFTDLILSPDKIRVTTYPIPFPGNKTFDPHDMVDFFADDCSTTNPNQTTYKVIYIDTTNHERTLIAHLPYRDQAEYICDFLVRTYIPAK